MYARTEKGAVSADILKAVCAARARNFRAAAIRRRIAEVMGNYLA